jgi:hypothetical protein
MVYNFARHPVFAAPLTTARQRCKPDVAFHSGKLMMRIPGLSTSA